MARHWLRVNDGGRLTGLNRSALTALYRQTAIRIELPAIEKLCATLERQVGELGGRQQCCDCGLPAFARHPAALGQEQTAKSAPVTSHQPAG